MPGLSSEYASTLKPVQDEYARLIADKTYLDSMMKENAAKASYYANKTLRKVYKKVGFIELPR